MYTLKYQENQKHSFNSKCYLNFVKKQITVYIVGKFGEKLSNEDEVSLRQEGVLVEGEDAEGSLGEEGLPVPDDHVPDPAGDVQGTTLAVQRHHPVHQVQVWPQAQVGEVRGQLGKM